MQWMSWREWCLSANTEANWIGWKYLLQHNLHDCIENDISRPNSPCHCSCPHVETCEGKCGLNLKPREWHHLSHGVFKLKYFSRAKRLKSVFYVISAIEIRCLGRGFCELILHWKFELCRCGSIQNCSIRLSYFRFMAQTDHSSEHPGSTLISRNKFNRIFFTNTQHWQ